MTNIEEWAQETIEKIDQKMRVVSQRNFGQIPYSTENGSYEDFAKKDIYWWTNGFFAGSLWQLYQRSGYDKYREHAQIIEELLDIAKNDFIGLHHDVGFMWLPTAVTNYRLTGNLISRKRGLQAASVLASRFNIRGNYIVAWNGNVPGWAIIDSLMNIPILFWGSQEIEDPRLTHIGIEHAKTLEKYLIREDGSAGHIANFNPETGEFVNLLRGQGYSSDSAWSRGQAWGIYGFALSAKYTKETQFLNTAKKIANYFIGNVSQTEGIPLIDFRGPVDTTKVDTSAGACAVCGLLEIASQLEDMESQYYRNAAYSILRALVEKYVDWNHNRDGFLYHSSHSYHQEDETNVNFVYGDYFLIEALLRISNDSVEVW